MSFTLNEIQIPCTVYPDDSILVELWKVRGKEVFYPTKIAAEVAARQMGKTYSDIYFCRFIKE